MTYCSFGSAIAERPRTREESPRTTGHTRAEMGSHTRAQKELPYLHLNPGSLAVGRGVGLRCRVQGQVQIEVKLQ